MQTKLKASQREEIINTKVEINEKENRKTIEKSLNQNLFFYKINKTDRQWTRKKKEGLNYKMINEWWKIKISLRKIKRIIWKYYE